MESAVESLVLLCEHSRTVPLNLSAEPALPCAEPCAPWVGGTARVCLSRWTLTLRSGEPIGTGAGGQPVFLREIWPSNERGSQGKGPGVWWLSGTGRDPRGGCLVLLPSLSSLPPPACACKRHAHVWRTDTQRVCGRRFHHWLRALNPSLAVGVQSMAVSVQSMAVGFHSMPVGVAVAGGGDVGAPEFFGATSRGREGGQVERALELPPPLPTPPSTPGTPPPPTSTTRPSSRP